ncbi:MAG: hypothetical protein IT337_17155, partial [Thermomicrobiales bacterium]|nr:hypothetical protein [Thermomicrobiales bacterium]
MASEPEAETFVVPRGPDGRRALAPTDLAQFIMMGQCRRHLRFRLYQHVHGRKFFDRFDTRAQQVPTLLTQGGLSFEQGVMEQIGRHARLVDLREGRREVDPPPDNSRVIELARALVPGSMLVVAQPLLSATVGSWNLRGQADLIAFRRD